MQIDREEEHVALSREPEDMMGMIWSCMKTTQGCCFPKKRAMISDYAAFDRPVQ